MFRARIEPGLITRVTADLGSIADDCAELAKARGDALVFVAQMDFLPVQSDICQNHSCAQVGLVAENRIADIIEMGDLGAVEYHAIFKLTRIAKDYPVANDHTFADVTATSDLAIIPDPGWSFNGRTVFNNRPVPDIDHFADKGPSEQTSVDSWIEPKLKITGDLLQDIPDLGRVIEECPMLCLAQVEVV